MTGRRTGAGRPPGSAVLSAGEGAGPGWPAVVQVGGAHRSGGPLRHTARVPPVRITQDPDADDLLGRDPLALLLGMPFDQHVR